MDFTSALYLGWKHSKADLPHWSGISTGKPSVLEEPLAAGKIAQAIARQQYQESGMLYPSTLHLFWDLFNWLVRQPVVIFYDRDAYPIALQILQRHLCQRKVSSYGFSHRHPEALRAMLNRYTRKGRRPVIISDGWCTQCGRVLPLREYTRWLAPYNGLLILDDTQALGILGYRKRAAQQFGAGGGGTTPWLRLSYRNVISGSSLAKGFGVPAAALCGPAKWVRAIREVSFTRMHCSPISMAAMAALLRVIERNPIEGEVRRQQLQRRILQFRKGLRTLLPDNDRNIFPVQQLFSPQAGDLNRVHQHLHKRGIRAVLTRGHDHGTALTFLLRADHSRQDIDYLIDNLLDLHRPKTHYLMPNSYE